MNKKYEFYIEKGFEPKYASYFANGAHKIVSVVPNEDFSLTLEFDNKEKRVYDMKPYLKKNTVFENIMDLENFKRVYLDDTKNVSWDIDPTVDSNVVWENKVDLCSDVCYVESVAV